MLSAAATALAALAAEPQRHGLFETLRRLQKADRDRPRIGHSARPSEDALRLGQRPSLAFAPSSIAAVEQRDGRPPRLEVHGFGLFGPNGPLPTHLTEYAHERLHNAGDAGFARFADVFHHRMLSLFFRAWATAQPTVDHDRPESSAYRAQIGSLVGIGRPALRDRDAMADDAKLHHTGRLTGRTRPPEALKAIVGDLFGVPVEVEEFAGEWIELPQDARARLGRSRRLGVDSMAGARTWSAQHRFRLRLGPLTADRYHTFLPGHAELAKLRSVVRHVVGDELAWQLQLVLDRGEVPAAQLGATPQRLGWSQWLGARRAPSHAGDLKLNPEADRNPKEER